ncbi:copper oxidase [Corynebacterium aquatimens]|uniref:copper oxidase n=1 Tax=Corynebacterium TaxID=1716 RepID=UPI001F24F443|nr:MULTISPECIES: copper oxidase [Corynebacterium]QYH19580.1 copper oxidase [Corynebacterium aquatimens]UIZ91450.1 copper oxidase [Corynebacterium sp. CNCTC7651]
MLVFLLVGLMFPFIPDSRWLLIHIFALGILTNSIIVWSQNLTERFLHRRLEDSERPAQLLRSRLLNACVVLVLVGMLLEPAIGWSLGFTAVGAVGVAGVLTWHGAVIAQQIRLAGPNQRFRPAVWFYVASAGCLVVGALLGAFLAYEVPGTWQGRVLVAHLMLNVFGFVGLAAGGSLTVLFPAMWRVQGTLTHQSAMLAIAGTGLGLAVAGALAGSGLAAGCGMGIYTASWAFALKTWIAALQSAQGEKKGRATYWSLSALSAVTWMVGSGIAMTTSLLAPGGEAGYLYMPVLPLLLGFAAQLLIGTMSYLLPTTMGGGPAATRAGLTELNRAGITRVVLFNVALICWLVLGDSVARYVCILVAFGCLVAFLPLLVRGVRAQRAVIVSKSSR